VIFRYFISTSCRVLAVLFSLLCMAGAPCLAQGAPASSDAPPERVFRGTAPGGAFDFYVLSLSWSPGFCATGGAEKAREQCQSGMGLGFVVHGLWPQFEKGFPSDCDPAGRSVSRIALEAAKGLFPSEGLARYEWRKHGSCSGRSPQDYFADVRSARDLLRIPPEFERLRQEEEAAPAEILRAFGKVNPRLRAGMASVVCAKGYLQEVRVCLSKDLREFRSCPEVARNSCRAQTIKVTPSL
jgi:ribonuclease T2